MSQARQKLADTAQLLRELREQAEEHVRAVDISIGEAEDAVAEAIDELDASELEN